jgi:hypothetical protein
MIDMGSWKRLSDWDKYSGALNSQEGFRYGNKGVPYIIKNRMPNLLCDIVRIDKKLKISENTGCGGCDCVGRGERFVRYKHVEYKITCYPTDAGLYGIIYFRKI